MRKALEDLYYGNINPGEQQTLMVSKRSENPAKEKGSTGFGAGTSSKFPVWVRYGSKRVDPYLTQIKK